MDQVTNFAKVTVDPDGNYDSSSTEIDVVLAFGNPFPDPPFNAVWWNASDFPDPSDDIQAEIVRVTAQDVNTLTITRAQEGTSAGDKNEAGKTYKLMAGLTALAWSTLLGDVFGSGTAVLIDADGEFLELRRSATHYLSIAAGGTTIEDTVGVTFGDPEGNGNSSFVSISDANQRFTLVGMNLATSQSAAATIGVGAIAKKLPIYDESGTLLGYIPIYSSIT